MSGGQETPKDRRERTADWAAGQTPLDMAASALHVEEGFNARLYGDAHGTHAIGYGWNVDRRPATRELAQLITDYWLTQDYRALCRRAPWFLNLSPVRQACLLEMAYQLGVDGLLGFTQAIRAIERGNFTLAAYEFLNSKWATTDTPARAQRVMERWRNG